MNALHIGLSATATLMVVWIAFICFLAVVRPRDARLAEVKRFVPDIARLVRDLAKDPMLPRSVRRRLVMLLGYLALPFDLVPDFVPVLGYADDVIIFALVLRSVIRRAGPQALERHWTGSDAGLVAVRRLTGIA